MKTQTISYIGTLPTLFKHHNSVANIEILHKLKYIYIIIKVNYKLC